HLDVLGITFVDIDNQVGHYEGREATLRDRHLILTGGNSGKSELARGGGHCLFGFVRIRVAQLNFGLRADSAGRIRSGSADEARVSCLRPSGRRKGESRQHDKRYRDALQDFHGASSNSVSWQALTVLRPDNARPVGHKHTGAPLRQGEKYST